ncbi:MAG: 50S ribosomal protein L18 [Gammaproteobacteria bacterium RIFCSPHIGHO2_12_FULL_42_13]|nr:MAG: 50S ribosomal protein L18 [Gammaproteobacteria bacterium RIFCSPHIGHO2_12_FULL_42_13]
MNKKKARARRAGRTRHNIQRREAIRLSVFRSANNIYAQVISPCNSKVLVVASTLDKDIRSTCGYGGNVKAATLTGALLAKRCKEAGIKKLAFDRSGYQYHGRVKALAEAVREGGVEF